jgi:hypothetical protein
MLTLVALLLHVAEELPNLPAWAKKHFGTTTTEWFVLSHIPLLSLAGWICHRAARVPPSRDHYGNNRGSHLSGCSCDAVAVMASMVTRHSP